MSDRDPSRTVVAVSAVKNAETSSISKSARTRPTEGRVPSIHIPRDRETTFSTEDREGERLVNKYPKRFS